jgi:hypothetical protein
MHGTRHVARVGPVRPSRPSGMRRMRILLGGPGGARLLVVLALASVAMALAVSGASFTARTSNTVSVAAGAVTAVNSPSGTAIVSAGSMRPGQTRQGDLALTNSGDLPASYVLVSSGLTDSPSTPALSATLDLTVSDVTGNPGNPPVVYSGKLGSFSTGSLDGDPSTGAVDKFSAGQTRTYRFLLSWPSGSTDPGLQGASTSLTFKWRATQ